MTDVAVAVHDLSVEYGGATALSDVTVAVPVGATVAVIGPNGSGKSTFLRAIAGLVDPARGEIETFGRSVAMVLQATDVDRTVPITVLDTVTMARFAERGLLGRLRPDDRAAVARAMARLAIGDLADRQLHDLSGGQRQRVLVAQGLAQQADILLLDEPITGLDLVSRDRILTVVDEESASGRTVIITTHSLAEARRCQLVLLVATRMVAFGPPDDVLRETTLSEAFGGGLIVVAGEVVMDDPHHRH